MKLRLIILLLFPGLNVIAQQCGRTSDSFDFHYGYRSFSGNFYNQFNKTGSPDFSMPLKVVGVGVSGRFHMMVGAARGSSFSGHFTYNHIIPQQIRVQDTLTCRVSGFIFSLGYGTSVVKVRNYFDLDVYTGFNTGRIKLNGNEPVRQKNPFFSPKIGMQPKFTVKHVAISLRCEYEYDISRSNWRKTLVANDTKVNLEKFRQSGITALFGIGYAF